MALIVTIIVLIILAAVTIKGILDHNLIGTTTDSIEKYDKEQKKETQMLNDIYDILDNTIKGLGTGGNGGGDNPNPPEPEKPKQDGTWDETKGVNKPKLDGTGLIPVYYNGTTWVDLTENSTDEEWAEWYDYADTSLPGKENQSKWANARTKDGSMWVWIPRYEYKIDTNNKSIDVRFISVDTKKGTPGYNTDSTGITRSSDGYIIHPAFIDDTATTFNNGGWDSELSGFWVAKYAAGFQNGTVGEATKTVQYSGLKYTTVGGANYLQSTVTANSTDITLPVFKSNTYAYNCISVGDIYLLAQKVGQASMYGLSGIDSHLEKNSEWGAVAYLTHSKYGLNANTSNNKEVTINSKNLSNTINSIGTSTKGNVYAVTSYGNNNNTPNDTNASSTKNMTGVFDLSGGISECTAGFYKGGNADTPDWHKAMATSSTNRSTKLMTLYSTANKLGDGMNASETSGWNNDYALFVGSNGPVVIRGGGYFSASSAGVFGYNINAGQPHFGSGFRVCLVP